MKNINIQTKILDFTKPVVFYAKHYGLSVNAIRNRFRRLGVYDKFIFTKGNTAKIKSGLLQKKYNECPKRCLQCKTMLPYENKNQTYCSIRCSLLYTQKNGGRVHWSDEDRKQRSIWGKKYAYRQPIEQRIKIKCIQCGKTFETVLSGKNRKLCSKKCYTIWHKTSGHQKGKCGGLRHGSGRGKQGWYKGYYCNSSWELAWVVYQLEHNIPFARNTKGFEYVLDGKKHKFYPDFIFNNGEYVEIKGYVSKCSNEKISQFPHKLNVLYKKDIQPYIQYTMKKYGKDFIKLYE